MTENKYPVAMFKQINGERVQIGWASPINPETNSRTFERSPGFEGESLADVSFEDDEVSQDFAAEHEDEDVDIEVDHNTVIEPEQPAWDENGNDEAGVSVLQIEDDEDAADAFIEDEHYPQEGDEGKDSQPLQVENNETVELQAGGAITDVADEDEEDEEAAFERELAEEQAQNEAPATRREARENNEESN